MLRKGLCLTLMIALTGCQSIKDKLGDQNKQIELTQTGMPGVYDTPSVVNYEKAARLNIELAMGYMGQNNFPRAKMKLMRALELDANLPETNYAYGYYLEQIGELQSAEKYYIKAVRLDNKNGKSHNNYGAFLCRQGRYLEAEKSFLSALEDPTYIKTAEVLENAGLCVMQIPNYAKAEKYFERALKHDPSRHDALLELANIKYQHNQISEAMSYYSTYTKLAPRTERSILLGEKLLSASAQHNEKTDLHQQLDEKLASIRTVYP